MTFVEVERSNANDIRRPPHSFIAGFLVLRGSIEGGFVCIVLVDKGSQNPDVILGEENGWGGKMLNVEGRRRCKQRL